jgi:hypothetical protein
MMPSVVLPPHSRSMGVTFSMGGCLGWGGICERPVGVEYER